jgi:membrane associated rhomboid family serine protease
MASIERRKGRSMGIYDREYYRREGPSYLGSFIDRGRVCKYLILINVIFFVLQLIAPHATKVHMLDGGAVEAPEHDSLFTKALILDPQAVLNGQVWRLLTHAFLHDGFLHILFNMLFLWWFGSDIEDLYGPKEFLAFYLVAALIGGLVYQTGAMISKDYTPALGASGAVTAVMVLCAFHYPSRIIYVWFIPMPIWVFVAFQVARDFVGFLSPARQSDGDPLVAFNVHLAGAAFAFAYYRFHWHLISWLPDFKAWKRYRTQSRSKLRLYREEEPVRAPVAVASAPSAGGEVDEQLEAKLDAVLQKVSKSGKESLTETERQILVRASEVYKKRRS